uniref:Ephrin RBD domain-containing protein n=1 Tax=Panagrellus redivivus TaxID=6233 RepID=A0A7E4VEZ6_PANRE
MTYLAIVLFALCLGVRDIQGKVDLKEGRIERVLFTADKLVIIVDNSLANDGKIQICFASSPYASYPLCPPGFASTEAIIKGYMKHEFTLNRQGQLFLGKVSYGMMGTVEFNEDKSLNITTAELPDAKTIVTLENAEIFVPEMPEKPKNATKKKSNASVRIVAVVVILILVGVIVGILVWFCVTRKPKSEQMVDCDYQDDTPIRKSSTHRKPSAKMPANNVSNIMTTITQTTVSPKQIAHPSPGINAQSPSTANPTKATTSNQ